MMTNEFSFNINTNGSLLSIKENFDNFKEEELAPINLEDYKISIDDSRSVLISWLSFLCSKLNFTEQSLFRCVSIFDQYISRISKEEASNLDKDYLSLVAIACLSLATKLEEINCNYVKFLNEKVLNSPNSKVYTIKDLTTMELKILKTLKYKTIYSTPLDFIEIYIEIFKSVLGNNRTQVNPQIIAQIKNYSINLVKNNINNEIYLTYSTSQLAYACFIQVLTQTNLINLINMKQFEKSFYSFNYQLSNVF
jgi:hypothetical protein